MKTHGTLTRWNDDRGFGFITPAEGGAEVFVHVSAFPRDGQRPRVGETLGFEIETAPDGRKRAKALSRPQQASSPRPTPSATPRMAMERRPRRSLLGRVLPLAVVVALVFAYDRFSGGFGNLIGSTGTSAHQHRVPAAERTPVQIFHCDGRTHCSQMTSCAEATYFLRNCPNTKMDGNNDGIPCEMQWCGD